MIESWDDFFCNLMILTSLKSKDESSKFGCVITNKDNAILTTGFNGFPRNIRDKKYEYKSSFKELCMHEDPDVIEVVERYNDAIESRYARPEKYKWTEHAERNAIYNAARIGVSLLDSIAYVNGTPCCDCARGIIQSGIKVVKVYDTSSDDFKERWSKDIIITKEMFAEADIDYIELDKNKIHNLLQDL
jgi:dCMP deaminase